MKEYLKRKNIPYEELSENVYLISEKKYLLISGEINSKFKFELNELESELAETVDKFIFKWGTRYFYSEKDKPGFNEFLYLNNEPSKVIYSHLGVHGKYELLNGSRRYEDWCKKAVHLGIPALGLVEESTLAGVIQFQEACIKYEIKPVIGQTVNLKIGAEFYKVKTYCKNQKGWFQLLKLNKIQRVDRNSDGRFITIGELNESTELIKVFQPLLPNPNVIKGEKYLQIDPVEFSSNKVTTEWLEKTKEQLETYEPILIQDSFYLEDHDSQSKQFLNSVLKQRKGHQSNDQYFKSLAELKYRLDQFQFPSEAFIIALDNNLKLTQSCNFKVQVGMRNLPKYEMNEAEKKVFENNNQLFWFKVNRGLEEKVVGKVEDIGIYLDRLQFETDILSQGNLFDYFLILSDVNEWCDQNCILRGVGRGSAAGSLVSWLLSIIEADPIKYDLLFERFLNPARLHTELADIDMDYSNRDAVKGYLENKYGKDYVCSIGTYGNYKVKNLFKDLCRDAGVAPDEANYYSAIITKEYENGGYGALMECAVKNKKLGKFFNTIADRIDLYPALLEQPRNESVHASGVVIVPKEHDGEPYDIYKWMPVKLMDGYLISEWEGKELEKVGFLKEDILGLLQLDKFEQIIELIKQNRGKEINIFKIPLDCKDTFEYFGKGITEDVFQFGTSGLKSYCKELKPNSIEELTAANALYRPGAIESEAHKDYIKLKFGEKEPEYDFLLEEITASRGGLYIYQEDVMKAFQLITDSSLSEADNFRKIVTKTKPGQKNDKVDEYRELFVNKYIEKGQDPELAQFVWDKLIAFSKYGFNRSHALCYSIMGYMSMWFKVHYPLEFWVTSLQKATDDDRPERLNEINRFFPEIKVGSVDINKSEFTFKADKLNNSIYYSITSVKFVGQPTAIEIVKEREKNGEFFSLDEFLDRVPKKHSNKRVTTNLILCGAFDNIENIKSENERFRLLDQYFVKIKAKDEIDKYTEFKNDEFWWQKIKAELSGMGFLFYHKKAEKFCFKDFQYDISGLKTGEYVSVAGVVVEVNTKNITNGTMCSLKLNCNNKPISCTIWPDVYEQYTEIKDSKGKFLFLNGKVEYNDYQNTNVIYSNNQTKIVEL